MEAVRKQVNPGLAFLISGCQIYPSPKGPSNYPTADVRPQLFATFDHYVGVLGPSGISLSGEIVAQRPRELLGSLPSALISGPPQQMCPAFS